MRLELDPPLVLSWAIAAFRVPHFRASFLLCYSVRSKGRTRIETGGRPVVYELLARTGRTVARLCQIGYPAKIDCKIAETAAFSLPNLYAI